MDETKSEIIKALAKGDLKAVPGAILVKYMDYKQLWTCSSTRGHMLQNTSEQEPRRRDRVQRFFARATCGEWQNT